MEIGENIKKFRTDKKLSQLELSKLARISRIGLINYEKGNKIPSTKVLYFIAKALNIRINNLITGKYDLKDEIIEENVVKFEISGCLYTYREKLTTNEISCAFNELCNNNDWKFCGSVELVEVKNDKGI